MIKKFSFILFFLITIITVGAQTPTDTTVFFVNIGPGSQIYELEGHSAIIVSYPDGHSDAYNYGVFDFNSPNFIWRFIKGETDYMATKVPAEYFLYAYSGSGRSIDLAQLNLNSGQKQLLITRLEHDIDPQFRTYRYNYVLNNCATRPLAAVEYALNDSVILASAPCESNPAPLTFRNIMRHYHANYPWYQLGIDLALGSGIDRPISRREASFAPTELRRMLPGAHVGGSPLVINAHQIQEQSQTVPAGATAWYLTPISIALVILTLSIIISIKDIRQRKTTKLFDSIFYGIMGLEGLMLSFLIFVSVHEATSPNWHYLWLNPLCLLPAICVWINRAERVLIWYHFINFAIVFITALTWHWIPQSGNIALIPLVMVDLLRSGVYLYVHLKSDKRL